MNRSMKAITKEEKKKKVEKAKRKTKSKKKKNAKTLQNFLVLSRINAKLLFDKSLYKGPKNKT